MLLQSIWFQAYLVFSPMVSFIQQVDVRWSDLDPNFHLRHSVYYDYGAAARIRFLEKHGISAQFMQQQLFGPIIFREECVFKKEIRSTDIVSIDITLIRAKEDYSRWTIQHNILKNGDMLSAILTLDGAWIDVVKRKLTVPPQQARDAFNAMPRAVNFEWIAKL